jgi:hypothetical protein
MIITIKANGDIVNIKPEVFYQGSTEANKIYLIAPLSINSVVELNFTLPNLHEIKNILMTPSTKISDNLNTWVLDIPASITQRIGLVKMDIIIRVNDNIITVNRTQFEVKRGAKIELPEEPEINVYEQIVQALAQINADYINKVNISYTDTENDIEQGVINNANGLKLVKTVGDVTVTFEVTENGVEIDGIDVKEQVLNAVATANEAKSIAENAENVALGIDAKASEALSNSEYSVEIADEAKAIALSVEQAKVFDTFADMETWLKDEANKEKHSVGLELLIKDNDVPDYWISAVLETTNASGYYYEIEATESKFPNADQISDEETVNKWSTTGEKEKVSKIVINGDGSKALLNDGTYGEVGTVDTVNNVLPDENKNITITADNISDTSTTNKFATAEELAQIATNTGDITDLQDGKVDKEFSSDYAFTEGLVFTWKSDTNTYRVGDGTTTSGNGYTGTATEIIIPKFFDDGVHGIAPVVEIGSDAFENCTSLTSITIPNSVTSIGNFAFENCSSLTAITIPNSATSIGNCAFRYCTSLTSIAIPNSVESIGSYAFRYCTSLTYVRILGITPPTLWTDAFTNTNNCPIYVPYASLTAYKTATNWSAYADRIYPIPEGKWISEDLAQVATTQSYTATLSASGWTGSSAPYSKEITVTGILATDEPTFEINFNGVYDDELIARSNLGLVYKYVTSANTITFYSDAIPTADIPLTIKVVR